MKNKIVLVVVILLLGVGGYAYYKNSNQQKAPGAMQDESQSMQEASPKTLQDLLGLSAAQKCTYSGGTVYVASGKMRGDFTNSDQGKTTTSHMIVMDKTSYVWTEGESNGLKMTFDESQQATASSSEGSEQPQEAANLEKPQDYKCESWVADSSMFELPSGVEFTDMSSFMNSMMPGK